MGFVLERSKQEDTEVGLLVETFCRKHGVLKHVNFSCQYIYVDRHHETFEKVVLLCFKDI